MERYFDDKLKAWVTVCPPGKALGSGDIKSWAKRRTAGRSGSDGLKERKEAKAFKTGKWPIKSKRRADETARILNDFFGEKTKQPPHNLRPAPKNVRLWPKNRKPHKMLRIKLMLEAHKAGRIVLSPLKVDEFEAFLAKAKPRQAPAVTDKGPYPNQASPPAASAKNASAAATGPSEAQIAAVKRSVRLKVKNCGLSADEERHMLMSAMNRLKHNCKNQRI